MKEIPLTKGHVAIVDDEDYEWLSQYKWVAAERQQVCYATCNHFGAANKRVLMHKALMPDPPEGYTVDHANRNGLDNRRDNLRYANRHQQRHNQAKRTNTQVRYTGVRLQKDRQDRLARPLQARVKINNKVKSLGYYATEEEAAKAFDAYQREHRGEFAVLNFP